MIFAKKQRDRMRDYPARIDASGHGWISLMLLLAFPFLLSAVAVIGYQDLQIISTPGNPGSGYLRFFATTGGLNCLTSAGANCLSGLSPGGTAGGDLSGTYPNPTVAQVNGAAVPASASLLGSNSSRQFLAATAAALAAVNYAAGGGSANAQTATYSPAIGSLVAGLSLCWLPTAANTTTTPTFSPNSLTAKTIIKSGGAALVASDLTTSAIACANYDGTAWELQNPQTGLSGTGTVTSVGVSSPLGGGPITTSGTLTCATCTITVANGTSALGTSAISSGACASVVTTAATGTATTDDIQADFNADPTSTTGYSPSSNGMLTIIKYPTSGNVNFKVCNNTGSSITPGAVTLNWRVVR